MAIAIKSIPVLRDKAAEFFARKAAIGSGKKSTVDFSKQAAVSAKILAKAKL